MSLTVDDYPQSLTEAVADLQAGLLWEPYTDPEPRDLSIPVARLISSEMAAKRRARKQAETQAMRRHVQRGIDEQIKSQQRICEVQRSKAKGLDARSKWLRGYVGLYLSPTWRTVHEGQYLYGLVVRSDPSGMGPGHYVLAAPAYDVETGQRRPAGALVKLPTEGLRDFGVYLAARRCEATVANCLTRIEQLQEDRRNA